MLTSMPRPKLHCLDIPNDASVHPLCLLNRPRCYPTGRERIALFKPRRGLMKEGGTVENMMPTSMPRPKLHCFDIRNYTLTTFESFPHPPCLLNRPLCFPTGQERIAPFQAASQPSSRRKASPLGSSPTNGSYLGPTSTLSFFSFL